METTAVWPPSTVYTVEPPVTKVVRLPEFEAEEDTPLWPGGNGGEIEEGTRVDCDNVTVDWILSEEDCQ